MEPAPPPLQRGGAADIRAPADDAAIMTRTYPIRQPVDDWNDFQVGVWASVLNRCRDRLDAIKGQKYRYGEILLGVSTLAVGASLSAWISGVLLDSPKGVAFFVMTPMIAVGCGVAYLIHRGEGSRSARHLADDALQDLPDPSKTVDARSASEPE